MADKDTKSKDASFEPVGTLPTDPATKEAATSTPQDQQDKQNDQKAKQQAADPSNPYYQRMLELQQKRTVGNMRAHEQEELLSLEKKFGLVGEFDNPGSIEPSKGGAVKKDETL